MLGEDKEPVIVSRYLIVSMRKVYLKKQDCQIVFFLKKTLRYPDFLGSIYSMKENVKLYMTDDEKEICLSAVLAHLTGTLSAMSEGLADENGVLDKSYYSAKLQDSVEFIRDVRSKIKTTWTKTI